MSLNLDSKVSGDKVGLSLQAADATSAATLVKLLLFSEDSNVGQVREAEDNQGQKTGSVEATDVDVLSLAAEGKLTMERATPDGLAWAARMMMGAPVTTALGTGYKHVFKFDDYPDTPAYFNCAHRRGGASAGNSPADYQRQRGVSVGNLVLSAKKNDFLNMELGIVGVGYVDDALKTETFVDVDFDGGTVTVTLANAVEGASDADRAGRIFARVDSDDDGVHETELAITSFVNSTKVLTLTDPGISGDHDVIVTYEVDGAETGYTWKADLEGLSAAEEFVAKATNMRVYLGASIDATGAAPVMTGGKYGSWELEDFSWTLERNAEAARAWRADPVAESQYAVQVSLGDVTQKVEVNRGVVDWLVKQHYDANSHFGVSVDAIGPEWESGHRYGVWIYFPRCKIVERALEAVDGKWHDKVEIRVLKEEGTATPTAVVVVQNLIASYA